MKTLIVVVASAAFMTLLAGLTVRLSLGHTYEQAALEVCRLVDANYYRAQDPPVRNAIDTCYADARAQEFLLSKAANIKRINSRLAAIGSSHLAVYDPDENRMMWENAGLDTGIRARQIEDQVVIFRLVGGSAGARAGLRAGDAVVAVDGDPRLTPSEAQTLSGVFTVKRGGKMLQVTLRAEQLTEDLGPTLEDAGGGVGLLRLRSFLGNYFENPKWRELASSLSVYRSVIVDLRENAGGSFPAMVRALSPFLCEGRNIGRVFRQAAPVPEEAVLNDVLDSRSQLVQLNEASSVRLRSFESYGCFDGPVVALVDAGTSSVSEIFAQSILTRPKSDLLGVPTAGQVVMARWFPIGILGSDSFQMAIPIAGFLTPSGHELEGRGVHPHAYLEYELKASLEGRDTFVEKAKERLQQLH